MSDSTIDRAIAFSLVAFACWTVACHIVVALGWPFWILVFAIPLSIVGGLALSLGRISPPSETDVSKDDSWREDAAWMAAAAGVIGLFFLSGSGLAFWAASVVFLAAACLRYRRIVRGPFDIRPALLPRGALIALAVLGVACAALTLGSNRPDADDAFFVSVAADAFAHPSKPPLSSDTMYGDPSLPVLLPIYRVTSIELLAGMLARTVGGQPIAHAHLTIPAVFAFLLPWAWASLFRDILSRSWLMATTVVFALTLLLGESHGSWGNFGLVRLFQGKAVLVSFFVPLLYRQAMRYMASGSLRNWILLAAAIVGSIGASSTGLFIVLMVVPMVLLASWRRPYTSRLLCGAALLAYPILLVTVLYMPFRETVAGWLGVAPSYEVSLTHVFGAHQQWIILPLMLGAWLGPSRAEHRLTIACALLLALLGPCNPLLKDVVSRNITAQFAYWRVFWVLPITIFCACGLVAFCRIIEQCFGGSRLWRYAAGTALLVVLLPYHVLRPDNYADFSVGRPRLKVPPVEYHVAQILSANTPRGKTVLAPEPISVWVSTIPAHPTLLLSRLQYVAFLSDALGATVADRMLVEAAIAARGPFNDAAKAALGRLVDEERLGGVVLAPRASVAILSFLEAKGFREVDNVDGYRILRT